MLAYYLYTNVLRTKDITLKLLQLKLNTGLVMTSAAISAVGQYLMIILPALCACERNGIEQQYVSTFVS